MHRLWSNLTGRAVYFSASNKLAICIRTKHSVKPVLVMLKRAYNFRQTFDVFAYGKKCSCACMLKFLAAPLAVAWRNDKLKSANFLKSFNRIVFSVSAHLFERKLGE